MSSALILGNYTQYIEWHLAVTLTCESYYTKVAMTACLQLLTLHENIGNQAKHIRTDLDCA